MVIQAIYDVGYGVIPKEATKQQHDIQSDPWFSFVVRFLQLVRLEGMGTSENLSEKANNPALGLPNELPSLSSSLLMRVQAMQPEAWARLVEVFSPIVYRWARQSGLSASDSADVVQDVFVAVAKNVSSFERQKQKASFRSWLATITRNRVRDCFRGKKKYPDGFGGTDGLQRLHNVPDRVEMGPDGPSDQDLEKSISLASLDQRLPERVLELVKSGCGEQTWKAFWATVVLGDSAADVAARLGMSVTSVYQAKSRILRRLRKRMSELP